MTTDDMVSAKDLRPGDQVFMDDWGWRTITKTEESSPHNKCHMIYWKHGGTSQLAFPRSSIRFHESSKPDTERP